MPRFNVPPNPSTVAGKAARLLKRRYGLPRLNNKDDPLDELIFIILSQMTTGPSYERVYEHLRGSIGNWDLLLRIDVRRLAKLIKDAGLSRTKAPRLKAIAKRLKMDFGEVSLSAIVGASNEKLEAYLTSLPGVGLKTAKCVMMYSLGRRVLPVDTHVARVACRLGLLSNGARASVHAELEHIVLPADRYAFHVGAITLGRTICRPKRPHCDQCILRRACPAANSREGGARVASKRVDVTAGVF
jgi:endonuclease III